MARTQGGKGKSKAVRLDARAVSDLLREAEADGPPVTVVIGAEEGLRQLCLELLLRPAHASGDVVERVSAADPGAARAIGRACEPSLFGGRTWLVASDLDQADEEVVTAAGRAVLAAGPDLRVVLVHSGAARGRGAVNAAERAGARILRTAPVAAGALPAVLTAHARRRGATLAGDAANALIEGLGKDVAGLLAAVDQLAADTADGLISRELVERTLLLLGSENQFEIADLVWARRTDEALVAFRQLVERQGPASACVMQLAALSYSLRPLVRYVADRPSGSPWQVASALGVPTWKLDALAAAAKIWRPSQLAAAAVLLAEADADSKGGLGESGSLDLEQKVYAVERVISRLASG